MSEAFRHKAAELVREAKWALKRSVIVILILAILAFGWLVYSNLPAK